MSETSSHLRRADAQLLRRVRALIADAGEAGDRESLLARFDAQAIELHLLRERLSAYRDYDQLRRVSRAASRRSRVSVHACARAECACRPAVAAETRPVAEARPIDWTFNLPARRYSFAVIERSNAAIARTRSLIETTRKLIAGAR